MLLCSVNGDVTPRFSSTAIRVWKEEQSMGRARFSEEQIICVLKEAGAGAKAVDLARGHGMAEVTIYNGRAKRDRDQRASRSG